MSRRPLRGSWLPVTPTPSRYRCQRCGIEKSTKPTRAPPELCADCKSVLRGLPVTQEETTDDNSDAPDPDSSDMPDPDRRPTAADAA